MEQQEAFLTSGSHSSSLSGNHSAMGFQTKAIRFGFHRFVWQWFSGGLLTEPFGGPSPVPEFLSSPKRRPTLMESSILSIIGTEITGVMSPVSICMLLLVYSFSASTPFSAPPLRTAATLVYLENPADTVSQKLEGALVFAVLIAAVTFLLVLLYYYNFTSFLKYYMNFSTFVVLATMGGSILISVIQRHSVPVDAILDFSKNCLH